MVNTILKEADLFCPNSVRINFTIYQYSSYKGTVGKIAENLLEQDFKQAKPYIVLHTDITQIRLANHDGLISQLLPTRPARKF
ncbi:hypothetical protein LP238_00100 (plasmid) [Companilactobacillus paralimentarius]|nr:hypothetical protein LP238_00100 [Companilactobacillus paralimentarius]